MVYRRRRDRRRLRRLARQESHAGGHARADFLLGRAARQRRAPRCCARTRVSLHEGGVPLYSGRARAALEPHWPPDTGHVLERTASSRLQACSRTHRTPRPIGGEGGASTYVLAACFDGHRGPRASLHAASALPAAVRDAIRAGEPSPLAVVAFPCRNFPGTFVQASRRLSRQRGGRWRRATARAASRTVRARAWRWCGRTGSARLAFGRLIDVSWWTSAGRVECASR